MSATHADAMEAPLAALARAQDELRNALAVGLGELRSAHDGVAVAASNEGKKNQAEREQSRVAIEREQAEREKLETKLTQCETALRETKAALVEARGEAKEVRDSIGRADARMRRTTTTRAVRTIATTARGRRDARANGWDEIGDVKDVDRRGGARWTMEARRKAREGGTRRDRGDAGDAGDGGERRRRSD